MVRNSGRPRTSGTSSNRIGTPSPPIDFYQAAAAAVNVLGHTLQLVGRPSSAFLSKKIDRPIVSFRMRAGLIQIIQRARAKTLRTAL
jgi:hypothetical protein